MAARRGKSQARRNTDSSGGLPGWAWMILGIVLALVAVLLAPKLLKSEGGDPFFRPQPNPNAQPAISAIDEGPLSAAAAPAEPRAQQARPAPPVPAEPEYDFYTVLPAQEVAMTDAEIAGNARAEADRQRQRQQALAEQERQAANRQPNPDAADPAPPRQAATTPPPSSTTPTPPTANTTPAASASTPARTPAATKDNTRYILQAGAFKASGDAEALKARIALLGLQARVESGTANGETLYRVRMGPYSSATELAEARQKLGNGGLPAMAIPAQ